LPNIVATLHAPCRFTCRLHSWQKQANQDADDGNDDKQFHERKATPTALIFDNCFHIDITRGLTSIWTNKFAQLE
jgi:hypothetical protein